MNIHIVSQDSFFITGVICLINQVWQPDTTHPVFLVMEENKPLLAPDIIITDLLPRSPKRQEGAVRLSARHMRSERCVLLFLASQCREMTDAECVHHHLRLEKKSAAKRLQMLFSQRSSVVFPRPVAPDCSSGCSQYSHIALSRQQAMVVKYTRQGLSLTDISRLTSLSIKTISTHKRAVMRKLGIKNNSEFYQYSLSGFIPR